MKTLKIDDDNEGVRIDRILRKELARTSLSEIYSSIRKGNIKVNGKRVRQNYRVKEGDAIEINIGQAELTSDKKIAHKEIPTKIYSEFFKQNFKVIYEDEWLLVCDKPAGLVVHAGTKHLKQDTLIDLAKNYIEHTSGKKKFTEPVLVHRLDRDTSGVILIAKNKRTLRYLHNNLRSREFEKRYVALCHGIPSVKKGSIELSLIRTHERNRGMKVKVGESGLSSHSSFRLVGSYNSASRIEVNLHTGRTHQIRVHMAHIACPVIGDVRYGDREKDHLLFEKNGSLCRLYLHAEQLSFPHPGLERVVSFNAPVPADFQKILQLL